MNTTPQIDSHALPESIRHGRTERIGIVSLEDGFELIKRRKRATLFGHSINVRGLKFATFLSGAPCCSNPDCGIKFSHFVVERNLGKHKTPAPDHHNFHLNLYGFGPRGEEIRFTHDHTLARSLGGGDDLSNTTSMCEPCNRKKSVLENNLLQQHRADHGLPENLHPNQLPNPDLQKERVRRFTMRMASVAEHEGMTLEGFKSHCEAMGKKRGKQDLEQSAQEMAQLLGMSNEGFWFFRRYPFHTVPGLVIEQTPRQMKEVKEAVVRPKMKMR